MLPVVPPVVALGFANLAMLGWLGAAAAPILIHLWMRQTHRETAWAAVRFLRAALERQARRLRLQHWLLLAVRTLLLVLLALAAAKPLLESGLLSGGVPTHRVLVIDASLSMSAVDSEGRSALEKAKQLAASLVDNSRVGDTYSLVVMGGQSGTRIGRPTSDRAAARRAIEDLSPTQGTAILEQALGAAQRIVSEAEASGSTQRQEIVVVSDMSAYTWGPLTESGKGKQAELLASSTRVVAFDVGDSTLPNAAVTGASLASGLPTLAAPVEVLAEARLFAGDSAEHIAELVVDGAVVDQQQIVLQSGETFPIDFTYRFERPGPRSIAVRLAQSAKNLDRLSGDNERHLAVTLEPRIKVLCIAGSPGAADYLADALSPTDEGAFEAVIVTDADLPTIALADYACVFLSNVREVTAGEAERLRDYVTRGGGIAWFLGDRVSPLRYNETLSPPRDEIGLSKVPELTLASTEAIPADEKPVVLSNALLPGWLSPSVSTNSFRVDPRDYAHPITRPFQGRERAGLLNTPVMRHFPIKTPTEAGVSVALTLENGDPLLVTSQLGRGRIAVLTTAATLSSVDRATGQPWTALPAWPSFLPIVRGLVAYLADTDATSALLVGDSIDGRAGASQIGAVSLTSPDGTDSGRVTPDETGAWSFNATELAGVYRYGVEGEAPTNAVAVNIDAHESDPAKVNKNQLPESLQVLNSPENLGKVSSGSESTTPFHRWLLYGALALALIEPAMACLFGRGSG